MSKQGYVGRRKILFDYNGAAKRSRADDKAFQTLQVITDSLGPKKHFRSRRASAHMLKLDQVQVQPTPEPKNEYSVFGRRTMKAMAS